MKELSTNLYGIIVPQGSFDFFIGKGIAGHNLEYETKDDYHFIPIPEDTYEILGTASEKRINFDCSEYVRKVTLGYWFDYMNPRKRNDFMYSTPNESFLSLIKSKGIELKSNEKLLVIKKL